MFFQSSRPAALIDGSQIESEIEGTFPYESVAEEANTRHETSHVPHEHTRQTRQMTDGDGFLIDGVFQLWGNEFLADRHVVCRVVSLVVRNHNS